MSRGLMAETVADAAAGAFWGCLGGSWRLGPLGTKATLCLAARAARWSCAFAAAVLNQGGAALVWADSTWTQHRAWLGESGPCKALLQAPQCERMWFDACMFAAEGRSRSLLLGWAPLMSVLSRTCLHSAHTVMSSGRASTFLPPPPLLPALTERLAAACPSAAPPPH